MVIGVIKNNLKGDSWQKPFCLLVGFTAFFAFYAFLHTSLYQAGILHPKLILFTEKALLVWKGFPPRLENFGFIYPPLPILIIGLFKGNLMLAQAFVSALISTALAAHLWTAAPKRVGSLMIYLALSFPILFLAVERFDLYLYFFVVLLSARLLYRYKMKRRLLDLFLAGPCLSVTFFIHYSAIYLLPMFIVLIYLMYREEPASIFPIALTFLTPSLAAFSFLVGINWMFTGDPFTFLKGGATFSVHTDIEATIASESVINSVFYVMKHVAFAFPLILPYIVSCRYHRSPLASLPWVMLLGLIYTREGVFPIYMCAVFILYVLIMTEGIEQMTPVVSGLLLSISLVYAPMAASFSKEPHERNVVHALLETGKGDRNIQPFQELAKRLEPMQGKILLDDAQGYPIVYLMKQLERFVLPYQYEFAVALSNPQDFSDYAVAVKGEQNDLIFERFKNPVQSFQKQFEDERIILWKRIG